MPVRKAIIALQVSDDEYEAIDKALSAVEAEYGLAQVREPPRGGLRQLHHCPPPPRPYPTQPSAAPPSTLADCTNHMWPEGVRFGCQRAFVPHGPSC